jgi:hypothetical protein
MAIFGQALMVGLIAGAVTNSALDVGRLQEDCEQAQKYGKEINKTLSWMNTNIQSELASINEATKFKQTIEKNHATQLGILQKFLKNQKDNRDRTQQLLSISISTIIVLFVIKILF